MGRSPTELPMVEMALLTARAVVAFTVVQPAAAAECYLDAARRSESKEEAAVNLGSAAMFFAMADQLERAEPLTLEGLRLACQHDAPSTVIHNLTARAAAVVDRDPDQARLRFRDAGAAMAAGRGATPGSRPSRLRRRSARRLGFGLGSRTRVSTL
jgi:hypothetical protein